MTISEVKHAIKLLNKGKTYDEVGFIIGHPAAKVRRYVRNFEVYGSSLWSQYPTPISSRHTF